MDGLCVLLALMAKRDKQENIPGCFPEIKLRHRRVERLTHFSLVGLWPTFNTLSQAHTDTDETQDTQTFPALHNNNLRQDT